MTRHPSAAPFLLAVLAGLFAFVTPTRADVVVTAIGPAAAVQPGREADVALYFLNTGSAAATIDAPAELPARLTVGSQTIDTILRRSAGGGDDAARPVPAGGFRQVPYRLTVPAGATGMVAVELLRPGSPRLAVAVAAPPSPTPPPANADGGVRVVRSADPSVELLPNRPQLPPGDSGIAEAVLPRFSPHEPIYFVAGLERPNAKFQVSFKYQVFNPEGSWSQAVPPLAGFHLAYSQTSFWDWEGISAPFYDNSYRPELLWSARDWRVENSVVSRVGLQAGVQHESNGQDEEDSRSLNIAYVRPAVTFGDPDGLFVTFAPRVYAYIGGQDEANADIEDYRGYADLRLIAGDRHGLQLAVTGRVGDDWDKGSVQFDLTYPTRKLLGGNIDLYLHAQYFTGYGESLLEYDRYSNRFRLGFSIVR